MAVCRCVLVNLNTPIPTLFWYTYVLLHAVLYATGGDWLHLSCPYTGCLDDSMAVVGMLLTCMPQDVASLTHRLPQLSSELEIFSVRKQGANYSHQNVHVQSCSWPNSSVIGKSHHVSSCQPWLHQVECTCLTATRWQSLKCYLSCTRRPEENDEPAADDLDCHKSHLAQSCCSPFNDGARGIQFSSGNRANLQILHLQHSRGHPSMELSSLRKANLFPTGAAAAGNDQKNDVHTFL